MCDMNEHVGPLGERMNEWKWWVAERVLWGDVNGDFNWNNCWW